MAAIACVIEPRRTPEDPLACLPRSSVLTYKKGQSIYMQGQSCTSIYLVIEGKVKVVRISAGGDEVILDIYQNDEFFGESALLDLPQRGEQAIAAECTRLMFWSAAEIENIVSTSSQLSLALLQIMARRAVEFACRIESFSLDSVARRLAWSLIRFSERSGRPEPDGSVRLTPFTHELLSQYVGTSREIVTHCMNRFRRQGYLRYSRKCILLNKDSFKEWLGRDARSMPGVPASALVDRAAFHDERDVLQHPNIQ